MKREDIIFKSIIVTTVILVMVIMGLIYREVSQGKRRNLVSQDGEFGINFIKQSNREIGHENYMISPYSVEIALAMLREGAGGSTLDEINAVIPERTIKSLDIKNKVNIANALFIKNSKKSDVSSDFTKKIASNYNASIIYDDYNTPRVINNWVNKKTNGMIPKILDNISPDFVMGIGNAVAMEEEWMSPFVCESTKKASFNVDNQTIDVAMMNKTFTRDAYYFENNDSKGIVLPYKKYSFDGVELEEDGEQLEFIGVKPNNIDLYIENFSLDKIQEIEEDKNEATEDYIINLSLPRFEFSYNYSSFKNALINMGLEETFGLTPDFTNMIYSNTIIDDAIHKTYIKVDEKGTKAAAVTYFGLKDTAAVREVNYINITFDEPFIFMIKDTKSNELLFFGVVYEPELWNGNNCDKQ